MEINEKQQLIMDDILKNIHTAADYLKTRLEGFVPEVGIELGSGLGKLGDSIEVFKTIPYSTIPNFAVSTAVGHKGNLIFGYLGGRKVCAMQGRFHYYEGYTMAQITLPVRVMKLLGIKYLFVSNAAGGVNFNYRLGDLMMITDHINFLPNPLIGKNLDEFGPRFPDMTHPYDADLIRKADEICQANGIDIWKGVYFGGTGPTYETPAEYKFERTIGADAVGMSTIPEVIVARHCGIPVFGISVITNEAHDDYSQDYENNADDVVNAADAAADKMNVIFTKLIESL